MTAEEACGFIASALVFGTFYMKRMIPLRLIGISSNVAFIVYAWELHLMPILLLHATLLPLNLLRLFELRRSRRKLAVPTDQ